MSIENVKKFYMSIGDDTNLSEALKKINEDMQQKNLTSDKLNEIVSSKIIPLAKERGFNFTTAELIDYSEEMIKGLSEDDLAAISGGIKQKTAAIALAFTLGSSFLAAGVVNMMTNTPTQSQSMVSGNEQKKQKGRRKRDIPKATGGEDEKKPVKAGEHDAAKDVKETLKDKSVVLPGQNIKATVATPAAKKTGMNPNINLEGNDAAVEAMRNEALAAEADGLPEERSAGAEVKRSPADVPAAREVLNSPAPQKVVATATPVVPGAGPRPVAAPMAPVFAAGDGAPVGGAPVAAGGDELARLRQQVDDLTAEVLRLQSENTNEVALRMGAEQALRKAQRTLAGYQRSSNRAIADLESERDDAMAEVRALQVKLATAEDDLKTANEAGSDLQQRLNTLTAANKKLKKQVENLTNKKPTLQSQLATAQQENEELKRHATSDENTINNLEEQLADARASADANLREENQHLLGEISVLENKIATLERSGVGGDLAAENAELRSRLAALEQAPIPIGAEAMQLKELQGQNDSLKMAYDQLQEKYLAMEQQLTAMESNAPSAAQIRHEVEQQFAGELAGHKQEIESLQEQLSQAKAGQSEDLIGYLQRENGELTAANREMALQLETLKNELGNENAALQNKVEELGAKLGAAASDASNFEQIRREMEQQFANERQEYEQWFAGELAGYKQEIESLREQLSQAKAEQSEDLIRHLQQENNKLTNENSGMEQQIETLKNELEKMERVHQEQEAEFNKRQNEMANDADEKVKQYDQQIEDLNKKINEMQGNLNQHAIEKQKYEQEIKQLKKEARSSVAKQNDLNITLMDLKFSNNALESTVKDLNQQIEDLNKQINEMQNTYNQQKQQLEGAQKDLLNKMSDQEAAERLKEQIKTLTQENAALQQNAGSSQEKIKELNMELEQLRKQAVEKKNEISELNKRNNDGDRKLLELENKNNSLQNEVKTLNAKVNELQKKA